METDVVRLSKKKEADLREKKHIKKKVKERGFCFCQLLGSETPIKTSPYHEASSRWAYMSLRSPSLSSRRTEDTDEYLHRTSSVFCSESIRCESMPLFKKSFQTTSKPWAQLSPCLLCSLSGDDHIHL